MRGACLCGAVRYEAVAVTGPIQFCHCRTCQRSSAANFLPTVGVARSDFRWLQGEDLLRSYVSSPGKQRYFCSVCGTHLLADKEGKPLLILRVATLDDDPGVRQAVHIWCSHDRPWLDHEDWPRVPEWQHTQTTPGGRWPPGPDVA